MSADSHSRAESSNGVLSPSRMNSYSIAAPAPRVMVTSRSASPKRSRTYKRPPRLRLCTSRSSGEKVTTPETITCRQRVGFDDMY